ncbi:MAG TPA: hypothetical protein VMX35_08655 [Acidobacteriota bacterium]|nr:hypothetical protein [Acidobacteriota bacterium]
MLSLAEIWRAGFSRISCGRKCREIRSAIERVQKERPRLLILLARAARESGSFGADFSASAKDLLKTSGELEKLRESLEAARRVVDELQEQVAQSDSEFSTRIKDAGQPFRDAQEASNQLKRRLERLESERTRLERALPLLRESAEKLEARIAEIETSDSTDGRLSRLRSDLQSRRRDAIDSEKRLNQIEDEELPAIRPEAESAARTAEGMRNELEELKAEASEQGAGLRKELKTALENRKTLEREARALEDSIPPLLFQLGEELNGRRIMHEALSEHYHNLDAQLEELKKLHTALGTARADLNELDKSALRFFWGLAIGAGALLVVAAVVSVFILAG